MKISCQTCQAKYTIADEKVLGKIVKIRCKKCGATIVINGNDSSVPAPAAASETTEAGGLSAASTWSVSVNEGDQRTMTESEVIAAFRVGTINDDTYCWADGMADWQALRDIPALATACGVEPSQGDRSATGDEATTTMNVGPDIIGAFGGGDVGGVQETARRTGGRAAGVDLFGGAARAGAEDEMSMTAPNGVPTPPPDADGRMTGQRNENSVLFSLAALTNTSGPSAAAKIESKQSAMGDGSGLIDIRALSAAMSAKVEPKKESSFDDIMNLSGGGAFAPALAAPVLGPPGLEPEAVRAQASAAASAPAKKGGALYAMIGLGAAAAIAVGAFFALSPGKPTATSDLATTTPAEAPALNAAPGTPVPALNPAAPQPGAATPPPAANIVAAPAVTPTPAVPVGGGAAAAPKAPVAAAPKEPKAPAVHNEAPAPAPVAAKTPAPEAPAAAPGSLEDEIRKSAPKGAAAAAAPAAAPKPPAAAGGEDLPSFNMGEAKARLAAIAGAVQSCKKPDGPTGSGKVLVTFSPSGSVSSATIEDAPFAGTPTGACIASHFRSAHVPAFSGSPFQVKKSFSVN